MKRILTIIEMVCVYALLFSAGVGFIGILGCGIANIFVEVPYEYYAYFGILFIIPLLLGYAYEGITHLIEKKK